MKATGNKRGRMGRLATGHAFSDALAPLGAQWNIPPLINV